MKKKIFLAITALTLFMFQACKMDGLDKDPNRATVVTPDLVLNGICNSIFVGPWDDEARFCQYNCCNYNYYGNQEYNWGGASLKFTLLKNVVKMEEEANRVGYKAVNPYSAMAKYLRASMYYEMTMQVGDLPLTEALFQVDTYTPKYNTQTEVFVQVLSMAKTAGCDIRAYEYDYDELEDEE
jgi:hypothetical protein